MSSTDRIRIAALALLAAMIVTIGPAWIGYQVARGSGSAIIALVDAGVGDAGAVSVSAAAPADSLHDPVSSPPAAWDDVKAARKVGWPLVVFAALIMLCKAFRRAGERFAWLATGKMPVVVGALGAIATSCYNAAADGGAWTATAFAGLMGLSHYFDAGGKASS